MAENRYKKKQRNLALMKFSTYFKAKGDEVYYFGQGLKMPEEDYDLIVYSTIFTFHFDEDVKAINRLRKLYPTAEFIVGGVSATLLNDRYYDETRIRPFKGLYDEIEQLKPDYDLFPTHKHFAMSQVFTSRGCRNKCGFCAVKLLEPEYLINSKWRDSIDLEKPKVMIHDNNITAGDFDHYTVVMDFLKETKLKVVFDNGFDCRYFTDNHLNELDGVKFERDGLRFAFDSMNQDGVIQDVIKKCIDFGISGSKIMAYVLFNYKDDFDEAFYRANEIHKLGARPYPQQYRPLDDCIYKNTHIGEHWEKKLLADFRYYWMMPGIYTKLSWKDYIDKGGKDLYKEKGDAIGV